MSATSDSRRSPVSSPSHDDGVSHANWREGVLQALEGFGLREGARIEQPDPGLTILCLDSRIDADRTFNPEGPNTFSLSICLEGQGTMSIEGASQFAFSAGSAVLFTSENYMRGSNSLAGGCRLRMVDLRFEPDFLSQLGGSGLARFGGDILSRHSRPDQNVHLLGFSAQPSLMEAARAIFCCHLADGLARELFLKAKAVEALSLTVDALDAAQPKSVSVRADVARKIKAAQAIIEARFDDDWTIARLAREVGLNERQLKDGFRHLFGRTVHGYLHGVRMDTAAALLRAGHSVTETALATGFSSLSHFSRAFKIAKGTSPRNHLRDPATDAPVSALVPSGVFDEPKRYGPRSPPQRLSG